MRRFAPFAAALSLSATPALADLADDYVALFSTIGITVDQGSAQQVSQASARIKAMSGRWMPLSILAGGGVDPARPPSADDLAPLRNAIAGACERMTIDIVPTPTLGIEVAIGNSKGRSLSRFQYAGGMDYVAVFDEAAMLNRMFPKGTADVPADTLASTLPTSSYLGRYTILPVGETILLVFGDRRPPDVRGRCPG
jgi:hypothetical protein